MAVVRILSGSVSFNALDYNYQRVNKGQAELLVQRNFNPLFSQKDFDLSCFKQYLQIWSSQNSRIKEKQFHVTISAKGKSLTKEQLQDIGERWLKLMGYSNNPYCIFFHHNTKNNHIHIVTTRVDPNGRKINDKFEKTRAVQILDKIIGRDRMAENRATIADFLQYSCSNSNQFFSILEDNGFHIKKSKDDERKYQFFKKGQFVCSLNEDFILWANSRYYRNQLTEEQKRKTKALLIKYANKTHSFFGMNELLRKQHGLSLVLYGGKDGKDYYGYSIIDYRNKCVYKGGEFANIRFLSQIIQQQPPTNDEALLLARTLMMENPRLTLKELNAIVSVKGSYYVTRDGLIVSKSQKVIGELDAELLSELKYNGIIKFCNEKYHPITQGERDWIASHYHVNSDDFISYAVENRAFRENDIDYYKSTIQSMLLEDDFRSYLGRAGYSYSLFDGEYVFYDQDRENIFSTNVLSDQIAEEVDEALCFERTLFSSGGQNVYEDGEGAESLVKAVGESISVLAANNVHISAGGGSSSEDEKRRKKKKK